MNKITKADLQAELNYAKETNNRLERQVQQLVDKANEKKQDAVERQKAVNADLVKSIAVLNESLAQMLTRLY